MSEWETCFARIEELRAEACAREGLAYEAQSFKPARLNQLLKTAAETLKEIDPSTPDDAEGQSLDLEVLAQRYVWSAYWRKADPPWPLEGFCSPKTIARLNKLIGDPTDPVKTGEAYS